VNPYPCGRCGQLGHWRAQCPTRPSQVPETGQVPVPAPAAAGPGVWRGNPVPARRPADQVSSHQHEHANAARGLLGVMPHCGDPNDVYDSPIRRAAGLPPIHYCQLRQIAAAQITEKVT
jgi:hypothetical protein